MEETKKEAEAMLAQAKKAFGNIAAASTGSTQNAGDGQQSAATGAVPGAVMVPTLPGYIVHGNDVSQQDIQQHLYNHPTLTGISPEMVAAVAAASLQFLQIKATAVSPVAQTGALPRQEGNAEVDQRPREQSEMDDLDPLTSDDEENERREANKKNEETVEKQK